VRLAGARTAAATAEGCKPPAAVGVLAARAAAATAACAAFSALRAAAAPLR
jgi:hypothetical protein